MPVLGLVILVVDVTLRLKRVLVIRNEGTRVAHPQKVSHRDSQLLNRERVAFSEHLFQQLKSFCESLMFFLTFQIL